MVFRLALLIALPTLCDLMLKLLGVPLPGAVAGFLLLFSALALRGGPSAELATLADGLVPWLPLMFVSPIVVILGDGNVVDWEWLAIAAGVTSGTCATLIVSGAVMQLLLPRANSVRRNSTSASKILVRGKISEGAPAGAGGPA